MLFQLCLHIVEFLAPNKGLVYFFQHLHNLKEWIKVHFFNHFLSLNLQALHSRLSKLDTALIYKTEKLQNHVKTINCSLQYPSTLHIYFTLHTVIIYTFLNICLHKYNNFIKLCLLSTINYYINLILDKQVLLLFVCQRCFVSVPWREQLEHRLPSFYV